MKTIVVGLGIQGKKRKAVAGTDCVSTVDPVNADAEFKDIRQVPIGKYDSALLCVPDGVKVELIQYLLENKKHVLVEKPLFSADDRDLVRLRSLAEKQNVVCYTAYNHRFEPHIAEIKKIVDSGEIGNIHTLSIFYGNGTARDVRTSVWRDKGGGVLPDLGSHLLDTVLFILQGQWPDFRERQFSPVIFSRFENKAFDHVMFHSKGTPLVTMEATLLSWRNTFRLDILGDKGSAHIECLCKWGPSTLTVRNRVLPSGTPPERSFTLKVADPTWKLEYEHFKELCLKGGSNLENDIWINSTLSNLGR